MPWAIFLCPQERLEVGSEFTWGPKHRFDSGKRSQAMIKQESQDNCIVWFEGTPGFLGRVHADPDCIRLATEGNINNRLTNTQATTIRDFLEARGIPADRVVANTTRRRVIRRICALFQFSQRMEGNKGEGWRKRANRHKINMNTRFRDLPPAAKKDLRDIRDSMAGSYGGHWLDLDLSDNASIRQVLNSASDRLLVRKKIKIGTVEV